MTDERAGAPHPRRLPRHVRDAHPIATGTWASPVEQGFGIGAHSVKRHHGQPAIWEAAYVLTGEMATRVESHRVRHICLAPESAVRSLSTAWVDRVPHCWLWKNPGRRGREVRRTSGGRDAGEGDSAQGPTLSVGIVPSSKWDVVRAILAAKLLRVCGAASRQTMGVGRDRLFVEQLAPLLAPRPPRTLQTSPVPPSMTSPNASSRTL